MVSQPNPKGGGGQMSARAVVFEKPQSLALRQVELKAPESGQVLVEVEWTGISTGTEKLLWSGLMPAFPGMGYPLVPGYETVGRVVERGADTDFGVGDRVFVSGASCFGEIRGLFGGAASRLVVDTSKLTPVGDDLEEDAVLLALAATAHHALYAGSGLPELIVGHGVLGRLLARLTMALGADAPTVWETDPRRAAGDFDYCVVAPDDDPRRDHVRIVDASGAARVLDQLMQRLARHGEIVLAGFYAEPVSFIFPPAFMREASIRIAAEWVESDLRCVKGLVEDGDLSLAGLISHRLPAADADEAYPRAFSDPDCLKMVLDWRTA